MSSKNFEVLLNLDFVRGAHHELSLQAKVELSSNLTQFVPRVDDVALSRVSSIVSAATLLGSLPSLLPETEPGWDGMRKVSKKKILTAAKETLDLTDEAETQFGLVILEILSSRDPKLFNEKNTHYFLGQLGVDADQYLAAELAFLATCQSLSSRISDPITGILAQPPVARGKPSPTADRDTKPLFPFAKDLATESNAGEQAKDGSTSGKTRQEKAKRKASPKKIDPDQQAGAH